MLRRNLFQLSVTFLAVCVVIPSCTKEDDNDITLTDADGNKYETVIIGEQEWMAEDLKTTKYNDGTDITWITSNDRWAGVSTGAYCWYDNEEQLYEDYGALYNWYAVESNKLCPEGWHVPTNDEWLELIAYHGGEEIAGGHLKEVGFEHWHSPNIDATNTFGFTALAGGYRATGGEFEYIKGGGYWWTSTIHRDDTAYSNFISSFFAYARNLDSRMSTGHNVRCIKD